MGLDEPTELALDEFNNACNLNLELLDKVDDAQMKNELMDKLLESLDEYYSEQHQFIVDTYSHMLTKYNDCADPIHSENCSLRNVIQKQENEVNTMKADINKLQEDQLLTNSLIQALQANITLREQELDTIEEATTKYEVKYESLLQLLYDLRDHRVWNINSQTLDQSTISTIFKQEARHILENNESKYKDNSVAKKEKNLRQQIDEFKEILDVKDREIQTLSQEVDVLKAAAKLDVRIRMTRDNDELQSESIPSIIFEGFFD